MITIRPQAGLGNRLRALDSAVNLSKKLDKPLKINWVRNKDCNCSFHDLFELTSPMNVNEYQSFVRDDGKIEKMLIPLKRTIHLLSHSKRSGIFFNKDIVTMKKNPDFWKQFKQYENIYLQTETSFLPGENPFQYIRPNDFITNIVKRITKHYNEHTLGIHIRRRDNKNSIANSPTQLFITKMKNAINSNPETNFFLATDSEEEENNLKDTFHEKIITYNKRSYDRNSKEAIQDALIDMLCLSRTQKIIGSFYSSFSEIAAQFGGIELEVIQTS